MFGTTEHDGSLVMVGNLSNHSGALIAVDIPEQVLNLATIFGSSHLMLLRIALKLTNQVVDITIEGCRE